MFLVKIIYDGILSIIIKHVLFVSRLPGFHTTGRGIHTFRFVGFPSFIQINTRQCLYIHPYIYMNIQTLNTKRADRAVEE